MKSISLTVLVALLPQLVISQDTKEYTWSIGGYTTNMQSFMFQQWNDDWTFDNVIHNRLNTKWFHIIQNLDGVLEMRNRFITGESVSTMPGYSNQIEAEAGMLPLSWNISKGESYVFNVKIDRLYLDYRLDKFQLRLGRQRINWGQCFTWNPNDMFNSYSFFDVDYIEKPGCDAIRMEYFTSGTSGIEMVIKVDSSDRITSAVLFRLNKWNYDVQFLGGLYNNEDYIIGSGWSGNISSASFRGEISYFHPKDYFADTSGTWAVSLGSEYAFRNSLVIQAEILYNSMNKDNPPDFSKLYNAGLSAKELSFTPYSLMFQASYPVTPLFNVTLSGMYFPKISGYFIGPSLTWSITGNIDFSVMAQSFGGQLGQNNQTIYYHLAFLRFKWNF